MRRVLTQDRNTQIAVYRQLLLDKRAEVLSSLGMKFDTLATIGRVAEEDQAQLSHEEFICLSLNSMDYEQLGLVEEAIDRLDRGGYGLCQACGEQISRKRLQAIPWARYCIRCQNEDAGRLRDPVEEPPENNRAHW